MLPLVKSLLTAGGYYMAGEVLLRGGIARQTVRRLALGIGLLLLAAGVGWVGLALLVAALFFYLAEAAHLVQPALFAGGITALVGLLLAVQAVRLMGR